MAQQAAFKPEWVDGFDGFGDVLWSQTACEIKRDSHRLPDAATDLPVMASPRTPKLLDREGRISRVQQKAVHKRGDLSRLSDRLLAGDMDDLHQRHARQGFA